MARVASFAWRTPPPTGVDEELAVFDDGSAQLVVRRPRALSAAIGTYEGRADPADVAVLAAAGPGPVVFELLSPPEGDEGARLLEVADRVAAAVRQAPLAVAEFFARPVPSADPGLLSTALQVLASGSRAVEFELDPQALSLHLVQDGQTVAWRELAEPAIGFMTPDAEGLGGLRSAARVEPGRYGAILFTTQAAPGTTSVLLQVRGWLRNALPDDPMPEPFEVRTAAVDLGG